MPSESSVSAILSEQPVDVLERLREQLERRIVDARAEIALAESELVVVDHALTAKVGDASDRGLEKPSNTIDRARESGGRFQGIPRAAILSVAQTVAYPITPARVVAAFARRGEAVNLEQIRVALNRIAHDGNLSKVGPSVFAIPGSLSSAVVRTDSDSVDAQAG